MITPNPIESRALVVARNWAMAGGMLLVSTLMLWSLS